MRTPFVTIILAAALWAVFSCPVSAGEWRPGDVVSTPGACQTRTAIDAVAEADRRSADAAQRVATRLVDAGRCVVFHQVMNVRLVQEVRRYVDHAGVVTGVWRIVIAGWGGFILMTADDGPHPPAPPSIAPPPPPVAPPPVAPPPGKGPPAEAVPA